MRGGTWFKEVMEDLLHFATLRKDCAKAFENADSDDKGFLTQEDYKVAVLELLGYKPSKYELDTLWTEHVSCHGDGDTGLSKELFMSSMLKRLMQKDVDELIRQVFVSFDVHLNGFLTLESCIRVFHEVAPLVKDKQIEKWFHEVDSDNDGRVTYRDFELMMKSHVLLMPPSCKHSQQ